MASPSASESPELPDFSATTDHFERLSLPREWSLDLEELETRYLELAAAVHPDRFAGADARTQRLAREHSAAVNEAKRVLSSPVGRAEYLVGLGGIDMDSAQQEGGPPMPTQAFLMEMIERREALADVLHNWDGLEKLRVEAEAESARALERAVRALAERRAVEAATHLVARRYFTRWLDEVEAAQDEAC